MAVSVVKRYSIPLIIVLLILGTIIVHGERLRVPPNRLVALDVGQGDAVLVQSTTGTNVLIDCGPDDQVRYVLSRYLPVFKRRLNVLIITHPDADHVVGCLGVLETVDVDTVMLFHMTDDLPAYQILLDWVARHPHVQVISPLAGDRVHLDGMYIDVLWPKSFSQRKTLSSNDTSYVTQIHVGSAAVMLTGDASVEVEKKLIQHYGKSLQSNVLKLGHHGSHTSSAPDFVDIVNPNVTLVSAGEDNRFGHPSQSVLDTLFDLHIPVRSTIEEGDVLIEL